MGLFLEESKKIKFFAGIHKIKTLHSHLIKKTFNLFIKNSRKTQKLELK